MARTDIPVQTIAPFAGHLSNLAYTAADATNNMSIQHPGGPGVFLIIKNESGGSLNVLLKGVANARTYNIATDKTISTSATEISVVALPLPKYDQGGGVINVDIATATSLSLTVIRIVPTP